MTRQSLHYDPPAGLEPEYQLLWAVITQARRDAAYQPRPGAKEVQATPAERDEAKAFLAELQPPAGGAA